MAQVTYLGPHDAVEVPRLNWQVFTQGVAADVPDDQVGDLAEQADTWSVGAVVVPDPAPAEPAPTEGS